MRNVSPIRGRLHRLVLLLAILIASGTTAFAFKTGLPFINIHLQIIEAALQPLGFSADAIQRINQGAASQDDIQSPKFWEDAHHCDNNQIKEGFDYFRDRCEHALDVAYDCYKNEGDASTARFRFGEGLHALQDFYSHSNWIEMQYVRGANPIPFRWDMYSRWSRNNAAGRYERAWTSPLPTGLKTGYFSVVEMKNAAGLVGKEIGGPAEVFGWIFLGIYSRAKMIAEIHGTPANAALQFAPESEFKARYKVFKDDFRKQLEYVTKDPNRSLLHLEINKDDRHQFEGSLKTPTGGLLFDDAKALATEDTARQWKELEKLAFAKYGGCAGLIIPGIKGAPIPEIRMKITVDRTQQARTRPVKGWVALTVQNLPRPMRVPIKVQVKLYLEPSDEPDTRESLAVEKILEFKDDKEQVVNLEALNLVIGSGKGRYDLVARACFDCDREYKPNKQRVPLGNSALQLNSAICTPNPMDVGETASLDVTYDYSSTGNDSVPPISGEGYIEKTDGTYRHTFSKKKLNPTRGPTGFEPYSEPWIPTQPGKYNWYPKLTNDNNEQVSAVVEIEVRSGNGKSLTGKATLNKNDGAIGDDFKLNLTYTIKGLPREIVVVPTESSQITQIDGDTIPMSEVHPSVRSGEGTVARTNTVNYKATKSGVFDWRVEIELPGYGKFTETLRFTVNAQKRLVVDQPVLTPESAPPGTNFRLHVDYHLRGMSASSSQEVVESSNVTGSAQASFPRITKSISSANGAGSIDFIYPGTTPGDYVWTYEVDAGPFGKERHSVAFRIENTVVRSIELVSASVTPVSGTVGATHTLNVQYRLVGLNPRETVEVHENDYVSFSKQEAHSTVTFNTVEPRTFLTKVAGFVSKQSGKHIWNFIIDAKGFRTLYGSVPFDVIEEEVKPQLDARLQYSMLTLAPGETKNCSIYISGYKGNTADRVEIVYPQTIDGWGTLPGQIQVFPGNTTMDPWSMRGAGDNTKEYAAGQGYRARETAAPGTTAVKIIVRQKNVGQVTLTLFVKIVEKNVNTMGTEVDNPRLPGTYSQRTKPPGAGDIPPTGEPDIPVKERVNFPENAPGTAPGDQPGTAPGAQPGEASDTNTLGTNPGGTPGSGTPGSGTPGSGAPGSGAPGSGAPGSGAPGSGTPGSGTPGSVTPGSGTPGSGTPGSGTPGSGTTTGAEDDPNEALYEFESVGIDQTTTLPLLQTHNNSTGEASVKWEDHPSLMDALGGGPTTPAHLFGKGVVGWSFPGQVTLQRDSSGKFKTSFNTKLKTSIDATVEGYPTGRNDSHTYGIFQGTESNRKTLSEKTIKGNGTYLESVESSYLATLEEYPELDQAGKRTVHEPKILLQFNPNDTRFFFDKIMFTSTPQLGVGATYVFRSTRTGAPGAAPPANEPEPAKKQLTARLEKDEITVEAGFLPSKRCNILINGYDRTTSKPVEVIYPGQGFLNNLPNDLAVVPGGGKQDPSALSAISSDSGEYTWTEAYEAKKGAVPGVYQVPIVVKQEGAGSVQLVLTIRVVESRSASGSLTMLQNRMTPVVMQPPAPAPIASQQMPCPTPAPTPIASQQTSCPTPSPTSLPRATSSTPAPQHLPNPGPTQSTYSQAPCPEPIHHPATRVQIPPTPVPSTAIASTPIPPAPIPPAPIPQTPITSTPLPHNPIPIIPVQQTTGCANWRNFAGTWQHRNGVVMVIDVVGNSLSGRYTDTGPSPQFQFYVGDPAFRGAVPISSDSIETSSALCFAKREDTVTPRAVNVRMTAKINCAGDHLYFQFWFLRYANGKWRPGSEILSSDEYTRVGASSNAPSTAPNHNVMPTPNFNNLPTFQPTLPSRAGSPTFQPTLPSHAASPTFQPTQPTTQNCQPNQMKPHSTQPTSPAHAAAAPVVDTHGFDGVWHVGTEGRMRFANLGGGHVRATYIDDPNGGFMDGNVSNGVFTGVYERHAYGVDSAGSCVLKLEPKRTFMFKGEFRRLRGGQSWTSPTGTFEGSKAD